METLKTGSDVPVSISWLDARLEAATIIAESGDHSLRETYIDTKMIYERSAAKFQAQGEKIKAELCFQIAEKWSIAGSLPL